MYYVKLSRTLISLTGADTIELLQGIISNDARAIEKGEPVYAAMLSPQGKFLHDFFLLPIEGGALLDIASDRAADMVQRLKIYRLRSKVDITPLDMPLFALWGEGTPPSHITAYADPRLAALGWRVPGEEAALAAIATAADESAYMLQRLGHGIPDTADMIIDKSLLLEMGFEELHGVSFTKGCYVGQEVTARSKHRAQLRKTLFTIAGENLPDAGTPITLEGRTVGEVRTSMGGIGLAVLNIEEVAKARAEKIPLLAGEAAIEASLPAWVKPDEHRED